MPRNPQVTVVDRVPVQKRQHEREETRPDVYIRPGRVPVKPSAKKKVKPLPADASSRAREPVNDLIAAALRSHYAEEVEVYDFARAVHAAQVEYVMALEDSGQCGEGGC